jgi:hypothetical protein
MAKSLDAWLINAIREELLSGRHLSAHPAFSAAKAVIEAETERADMWRLEKIAAIAQREFGKLSRVSRPYQDYLPGMDLADQLPLRKGAVPLGQCTIQQLRESVTALRAAHKKKIETRVDPRVGRVRRLILEMAPYARRHHGLTVTDYCDMRAAGVEAGAKAKAAQ